MPRFYITTPIYYVNDVPHVGTAYTTIIADALRRYHLLRGHETRMLTGTDEHGQKIEREAQGRGVSPAQFVDEMSKRFETAWPKLEVCPDDFIRTTQARHTRSVQEMWRTIERNGDLYEGTYDGFYCYGCEEYKTEKDLLVGNICPLHNRPAEWLKEETYFFRLSKYTDRLLDHYRNHPEFIEPEGRRNEVLSFVESGLKDLSVSRTSFTWGIPVPGKPKHVMYVWFDALANYWTALQDGSGAQKFWDDAEIIHLVGKDILRFHAVVWPAFLMSAGMRLPTTVFAHGFLTFGGQKMSKSLRNAVDPIGIAHAFREEIARAGKKIHGDDAARTGKKIHGDDAGGGVAEGDDAGADVLRYQLLRAIAFGQDGDFDLGAMVERYNADLGKNLGNLLSRTLGLCTKMTGGKVPQPGQVTALEKDLLAAVEAHWAEALTAWDRIEPHRALERIWAISSLANQYVDRAAPWAEDKKGNRGRVDAILHTLISVLGALSALVWPALPKKGAEMRQQLGLAPLVPAVGTDWLAPAVGLRTSGEALAPGAPLFPTLDEASARALVGALTPKVADTMTATTTTSAAATTAAATTAEARTAASAGEAPSQSPTTVTYDSFSAIDLRVGIVRTCERVPKKDKLLKLAVDIGEAEPRTIVAGLALSFQPEQLVAKRVVVVANLAPREFGKGLVSHGMLLATGPSEKLHLATVEGDVAPGARLK